MLSKMMPGDPLTGNFSQGQSAAQMAALRQQYGLNDPWYIQYFKWVGNMFHGDLGQSFVYNTTGRPGVSYKSGLAHGTTSMAWTWTDARSAHAVVSLRPYRPTGGVVIF